MDAEETAVGDRAGVRHGEPARAGAPPHEPGRPVPHNPRTELRKLVRGIAAGEHVEDVLELGSGEVGEGIRAADELVQIVDRDLLVRADRDDLLREDVERVARDLTCPPRAIAGQPAAWAEVGAANARSNHVLVSGEKAARTSTTPG